MRNRRLATLVTSAATIALVIPALTSPAAGQPQRANADAGEWCVNDSNAAGCVVGATQNGVSVSPNDPNWVVSSSGSLLPTGEWDAQWSVGSATINDGLVDMGTSQLGVPWSVTINTGLHVPRSTDSYGNDVVVTREHLKNGDYHITIAGQPVTLEDNSECHAQTPVTCPDTSGKEVTYFGGEADDFGEWADPSQLNDFYGMDSWTNVEETDIPPQISGDPAEIQETLVNSRLRPNSQVFEGFYHIILPNAFLVDMGVDDPTTLATDGIAATIGAGSVSVTPGPDSTEVDVTGITFPIGTAMASTGVRPSSTDRVRVRSTRTLRIDRGDVTPSRPTDVHVRRSAATHGRLTFHHAKPRGSKITGYQARCVAAHHPTRTVSGKHSPLVDKHLAADVRYRCQVRAKSKAGHGGWSKKRSLAAR